MTRHKFLSTKILNTKPQDKALPGSISIDEVSFITTSLIENDQLKKILKGFLQQRITAVFTSKKAVLAFDQIANAEVQWKIFCIGHSTKDVVAKIFDEGKICGVADNAEALGDIITADSTISKVIFFCGDHRRDELPSKLKSAGIAVEEITVYETLETPEKVPVKNYDGILFFSPSAVKSFFSLNSITGQQTFAIGKTTADAIHQHTNKNVIVAEIPSEENMIKKLIEFSTTKTR